MEVIDLSLVHRSRGRASLQPVVRRAVIGAARDLSDRHPLPRRRPPTPTPSARFLLTDDDAPLSPQRHVAATDCDITRRSCGRASTPNETGPRTRPPSTPMRAERRRPAHHPEHMGPPAPQRQQPRIRRTVARQSVLSANKTLGEVRLTNEVERPRSAPYTGHFIVHGPLQPLVSRGRYPGGSSTSQSQLIS